MPAPSRPSKQAPSLTAAHPVIRNIGSKDIGRLLELQRERAEIESTARRLKRQEDELAAEIMAYVADKAGKVRTLDRCGYRLSIVAKPGSVSWQSELQTLVGAARIEELKAAAPARDKLQVEKA